MLFDGMHGAGGIFAKRVLVDELGLPEVRPFELVSIDRTMIILIAFPQQQKDIINEMQSIARLWQMSS